MARRYSHYLDNPDDWEDYEENAWAGPDITFASAVMFGMDAIPPPPRLAQSQDPLEVEEHEEQRRQQFLSYLAKLKRQARTPQDREFLEFLSGLSPDEARGVIRRMLAGESFADVSREWPAARDVEEDVEEDEEDEETIPRRTSLETALAQARKAVRRKPTRRYKKKMTKKLRSKIARVQAGRQLAGRKHIPKRGPAAGAIYDEEDDPQDLIDEWRRKKPRNPKHICPALARAIEEEIIFRYYEGWVDYTFYTHAQWKRRGEKWGNDSVCTLTGEGGLFHALNSYGDPSFDAAMFELLSAIANVYGLWWEMGYHWTVHFYWKD